MSFFSRAAILERLARTIEDGTAVLGAGCSVGLIAKCAESAGADLILVYSTGRSRLMGLPTWRTADSNDSTVSMADEILNVATKTPIVGGVDATDPRRIDLERLIHDFLGAGFSGLINFPTVGTLPDMRSRGQAVGFGFEREVELIRLAHAQDIFTMAYCASSVDALALAEAGADCIVTHSGPTAGGLVGYSYSGSFDDLVRSSQAIIDAAMSVRSDVICLLHGGLLSTPTEVGEALRRTTAVGFVGASSIERIPVEEAVIRVTSEFKALHVRRVERGRPD
jgi:predicted TIM-barrel enzyme